MSASAPTVSVIIPAYRQAQHIEGCLDSIAAQSYAGPIEVIVVDDGSPDDSAERAARHPASVRVIRRQNGGAAAARNTGIEAAGGEYLAFVDADDRWLPNKLSRQLEQLRACGKPAICFTRYRRVDVHGARLEGALAHPATAQKPTARKLVMQNFIGCSTVLIHRACLERVGGFPTDEPLKRCGQDYALWLRVAAYFPLVYLREILVLYTVHQDNRVGIDRFKHFSGGMAAVRALHDWSPARAKAMAAIPYSALIARRAARFFGDFAGVRGGRAAANDAVKAWRLTREMLRQA